MLLFRIENLPTDTLLTILEKTTPSDLCKIRQTSSRMDSFIEQYRNHLARKRRDNVVLDLEITEELLTVKANKKVLHSPVQQLSAMHIRSVDVMKMEYPAPESVLLHLFQTLSAIFSVQYTEDHKVWAKTPLCGLLNLVNKEIDVSFCFDFTGYNAIRIIEELYALNFLPVVRIFSLENKAFARTLDDRYSLIWTLPEHLSCFDEYGRLGIIRNPEKVFALELPSKSHLLIAFLCVHDKKATLKRHPFIRVMDCHFQQTVMMVIIEKDPNTVKTAIETLPFSDIEFRKQILEGFINRFF